MRAPAVIVVAAIAHAALFGVLAHVSARAPRPAPTAEARAPAPRGFAEVQPIEITFLEPEPPSTMPPRTVSRQRPRVASHRGTGPGAASASLPVAAAASASASGPASESATGGEPRPGSPPGEGTAATASVDIRLPAAAAERIAAGGKPLQAEPHISGKLQSTPGGRAVTDDAVTTMTMEPDGNIALRDKSDFDIKLKLPIPRLDIEGMRQDAGRLLSEWYRDPYAATRFGPMSDVSRVWKAVPDACTTWGDMWCDDALAPAQERYARDQKKTDGSLAGGTADITAWLHRKFIGDPYASRKLKLLDDTREERIARGGAYRRERLDRSAELVLRTLEQLWASELDPVRRRIALFELWDECDEGEGPRGEAGERARAMIIGWIRTRVPRGSADAYSVEEIGELDARRGSTQSFTPY